MRVLVVEDDRALGAFLQKGLQLEGHDVEVAGNGEAALACAAVQPPDLMVLDLGLPGPEGMEVLKAMRRDFEATAVLALTGRNQMEERVLCLDLGADDCMLKPFSLLELTARCRALLRRREHFADPMLRFGGVEINRMDRSVRYEGVEIVLTVKEYLLLEFLLKRKGGCCSRAELLTEVWQSTPGAGTNIVDVYITYLRRKFAAARRGESPRGSVIETVRGSGYRIRDQRRIPRMEPAAMLAALQTAEEPEHIELPLTA